MSIQLTIHSDCSLIIDFPSFLADLIKKEINVDDMPVHLKNFISIKNITNHCSFDDYAIQEVNKCYLIYRGLKHLFTVKFEI